MSQCSFVGSHSGTDEYEPSMFGTNSATGSDAIRLNSKFVDAPRIETNLQTLWLSSNPWSPEDLQYVDIDNDGDEDVIALYDSVSETPLVVTQINENWTFLPSNGVSYALANNTDTNVWWTSLNAWDFNNDWFIDILAVAYSNTTNNHQNQLF